MAAFQPVSSNVLASFSACVAAYTSTTHMLGQRQSQYTDVYTSNDIDVCNLTKAVCASSGKRCCCLVEMHVFSRESLAYIDRQVFCVSPKNVWFCHEDLAPGSDKQQAGSLFSSGTCVWHNTACRLWQTTASLALCLAGAYASGMGLPTHGSRQWQRCPAGAA